MEIGANKSSYKFQGAFGINSVKRSFKQELGFVTEELQQKKCIHPRSPHVESCATNSRSTESSLTSSGKQSITMTLGQTPPAKRYQKVRNPFDAALTERLHLPLIASPLFQQPVTPQMSSTKFEWTIDEVSSLIPVNVEAHETQFQDSPDPDLEAKAQVAITSYFNDQRIVPSPVDCPLRNHRVILANTPIDIKNRRVRDCGSQTELTLPPRLPPHLEEALKPYFKPQLCPTNDISISRPSRLKHIKDAFSDTSLRRKLFDMNNVLVIENNMHDVTTNSDNNVKSKAAVQVIMRKLSDSLDKSSLDSFSPISAFDSLSPFAHTTNDVNDSVANHKSCIKDFFKEEDLELSPIRLPHENSSKLCKYESTKENINLNTTAQTFPINRNKLILEDIFTPERSSSPLGIAQRHSNCVMNNSTVADLSSDSFNIKVSRLKMNTSETNSIDASKLNNTSKSKKMEMEYESNIDAMDNCTGTSEDMQCTSQINLNDNFSNNAETTPRSRRRSISRKNLSQSFTSQWVNSQDDNYKVENDKKSSVEVLSEEPKTQPTPILIATKAINNKDLRQETSKSIARTDSGFTEMSNDNTTFTDEGMFCIPPTNQDLRIYI